MKIAFRRLPFDEEQKHCLNRIATGAGYETLWLDADSEPTAEALRDCEALLGYFPRTILKSLPALRWVQVPSAGVDWICGGLDPDGCVTLTNCSGAFGTTIAEYMLCALMMLMRNMPAYMNNQRARRWAFVAPNRTIAGSTVTVVGMGDIGGSFARRAKALGARVRGVRRHPGDIPEGFDEVFPAARLADAVRGADAVALCLPSTRETEGVFSRAVIEAMSPEALLVNCGRGRTVDQDALIEALRERRIGGAALDVFVEEPLPADSPLWSLDNVIVTPHVSGLDGDRGSAAIIYEIFLENLRNYVNGQPLTHVVDIAREY